MLHEFADGCDVSAHDVRRRGERRPDRDLLFDALANLVDNAIKHGREAGQVTVEVIQGGGGAVISVADDGPGIPADECQQVFKRFYRLEHSRRTPGNGLDLSLVAAVARLHGARIEMADNAPGLKFKLLFLLPNWIGFDGGDAPEKRNDNLGFDSHRRPADPAAATLGSTRS